VAAGVETVASEAREAHGLRAPQRILLVKIGLDGHDRGIKIVARGVRDAGFHVIYGGIWQSIGAVVQAVADEDVQWLGISLLSGAHMTLVPRLIDQLRQAGLGHVGILVGGIVPEDDATKLRELGVAGIFGPGTSMPQIADFLNLRARDSGADAGIDVHALLDHVRQHDRLAMSRLLSLLARRQQVDEIRELLGNKRGSINESSGNGRRRARTIAITGSAGVGKSTLIGGLLKLLRGQNLAVAVLACDPQSPLNGGALLGDRIRMGDSLPNPQIFIRSLAVASGSQGVDPNLDVMVQVLEVFGFDVIMMETGGIGQGDVAVRNAADTVVVLLQPETGDAIQWEKAGLLEIADLIVVHKSDMPSAARTEAELREHLNVPGCRAVPVLRASACRGEGLQELWAAIQVDSS
jgi:LAO/AO transport system ATPase